MNKNSIRTRFAPSPTGFLHIGGLRTALYNYVFSKKNNGELILRIEDTDQKRLVKNATSKIIKSLKSFNIEFDEGPNVNEKYGPYKQSERLESRLTSGKLSEEEYAEISEKLENSVYGWFKPPEIGKKAIVYGLHGGATWPGSAVDPKNNLLFTPVNEVPFYVMVEGKTLSEEFPDLKDKSHIYYNQK